MHPSVQNQTPRQCASDAMAVWERAAEENKPVGVDRHGNVTLLFGASIDSFQGPASQRQVAKDAILSKMRSEMVQHGSWNGTVIYHVMASQLPSLSGFVSGDRVGQLRSEWETLRSATEASLNLPPDVLAHRMAVAERISPFLPPGLGVSLHDNGLSWLTHTFSDRQQQRILAQFTSLSVDTLDPVLNLDPQMLKDLNRDTYDIALPEGMSGLNQTTQHQVFHKQLDGQIDLTPRARQTIRQLHVFCGGDLNMMATLSKLINQKTVLALLAAHQTELRPASGTEIHIHANSKKANAMSVYRLHRTQEGDVTLLISYMKKGSSLRDDQMQPLCRLKPGPKSEIADESHFNFRCCTEIFMRKDELKEKKIYPTFMHQSSVDYVLDIDWNN